VADRLGLRAITGDSGREGGFLPIHLGDCSIRLVSAPDHGDEGEDAEDDGYQHDDDPRDHADEEERGQAGDDRDSQTERQPNADEIGGRVGAGS
jgi:hypothetical protein